MYTLCVSKFLTMRWDESLVAAVDRARGSVSRSEWIRRLVVAELGEMPAPVLEERPEPLTKEEKIQELRVAAGVKVASEVRYFCPVAGCGFSAPSSTARCQQHSRALIKQ